MCSCQVSELSSLNFGKLYKAIKSVTDNISQCCVLPNIYKLLNTSSNCNHLHQQVLLTTSISVLRCGGPGWQGSDQVLHASPSRWQLHADHGRGERQRRWSSPHSEWGQKWNKYKCSHAWDPWALAMLIRYNKWKKGLLLEVAISRLPPLVITCQVNLLLLVDPSSKSTSSCDNVVADRARIEVYIIVVINICIIIIYTNLIIFDIISSGIEQEVEIEIKKSLTWPRWRLPPVGRLSTTWWLGACFPNRNINNNNNKDHDISKNMNNMMTRPRAEKSDKQLSRPNTRFDGEQQIFSGGVIRHWCFIWNHQND